MRRRELIVGLGIAATLPVSTNTIQRERPDSPRFTQGFAESGLDR
jgi:hypothetical protein